MSIIKDKIEEHIVKNSVTDELQSGFSKGSRIENNIFILKYCRAENQKAKKMLVLLSIDYKKAFDSINRKELIKTLKEYGIAENIIDIIARIYKNDLTYVHLREDLIEKMEIGNGIRQGCTGSSVLFKLVTYMIIKGIQKECYGFQNEKFKINCLFFADDSLIMEENMNNMKRTLRITTELSNEYGLELNKNKCKILVFNRKTEIKDLDGIEVVNEIKYLGFTINNKKNMFLNHKEKLI